MPGEVLPPREASRARARLARPAEVVLRERRDAHEVLVAAGRRAGLVLARDAKGHRRHLVAEARVLSRKDSRGL